MVTPQAVRRLTLEKQLLTSPPSNPGKAPVYETVEQLGCVQIDSINVVERAHYLTLWARLGHYQKKHLEELAYRDRKLFEYWAHGNSYIPTTHYRYFTKDMKEREKELLPRLKKRTGKGKELVETVLKRIKTEGPLASKDFDTPRRGQGGWWNRKEEKIAMDYLFNAGILMVSHRENFQRYYDLTENILPSNTDLSPPTDEERAWFFIEGTLRALGAIQPREAREYYQSWCVKTGKTAKQIEAMLVARGEVVAVEVEGAQGPYYCLEGDASRLEELEDDFGFEDVNMLVYFDNYMWLRNRVRFLHGFEPKLEVYIPRERRMYGYYHLPILYGDRLVARVEPKMDRAEGKLLVKGYWTEPGFKETEDYQDKLQKKLEAFASFHGAHEVEWLC